MTTSDWIGAVGVAITLIAYFSMSIHWISSHSRLFFLLNTVGAALTCFSSWLISYWPFFVLEGTWTIISLVGLVKAQRQHKGR